MRNKPSSQSPVFIFVIRLTISEVSQELTSQVNSFSVHHFSAVMSCFVMQSDSFITVCISSWSLPTVWLMVFAVVWSAFIEVHSSECAVLWFLTRVEFWVHAPSSVWKRAAPQMFPSAAPLQPTTLPSPNPQQLLICFYFCLICF